MGIFKKTSYQDPAVNANATEFEVNNWIISEFIVKKLVPVVGVHPFPLNELMLMTGAVCRFKPSYIFEWGTNIGKSARVFYETIKAFHIPCEIHSIDLPDEVFHKEHPQKNRGKLVRGLKEVTLHQADGLTRSFEIYDQSKTRGNVLFFVDGDHSYTSVMKELSAILQHIPHAAVLLHDTFYQSENAGYNTGPYLAVRDVLAAHGNSYKTIVINTGLPGMTLVYRK
ncbi:MAG TPA: class I SAM-dependent methyltransferase [Bacteroidia bacterium]|nr:class I SAM-dependent methyltransferase [Bacteroidia bacterium]